MSTNEHDHDTENVAPIKTPKQLITVVILAFVVPVVIIGLLTMYVGAGKRPGHGSDALAPESIEARIRPVAGFELRDAPGGGGVVRAGEEVFKGQCAACHTTGAAGAPKVGDEGAWAPRLKQGFDDLWQHALKGKGAMPPQSGGEYSDFEIARAVVYMANQSGGKLPEPKAPAGQAAAGGDGSSAAAPTPAEAPAAAAAAAAPAAVAAAAALPAAAPAAGASSGAASGSAGKATYESACLACHGAGVAGAPKFGDKAAWADRLKGGKAHLYEAAIKGKGAMPPKGGRLDLSDDTIKAAVDYMADAAK